MKQVWKWLRRILWVIPITLLIILLLLPVVLFTNAGLTTTLWAAQKLVPELKVGSSEGSLLSNFTLRDIEYAEPSMSLDAKVKEVNLAMTFSCLFDATVCIHNVAIDGLKVDMPTLGEPTTEPMPVEEPTETASEITIPLPVSIDQIKLTNIDMNILGNKVNWDSFTTSIKAEETTVTIAPTLWQKVTVELAKTETDSTSAGSSSTAPPQTDDAPTTEKPIEPEGAELKTAKVEPVNSTPLSERPDIELPTIVLPINLDLQQFDLENFTLKGESPVIVNHLGFQLLAKGSDIELNALTLDMPEVDLDLAAKVKLADDYPLQLDVNAEIKMEDLAGQKAELSASGSAQELVVISTLSNGIKAKLNAKLQPLKAVFPFDVELTEGDVKWPLTGESEYQVNVDSLIAKGSLDGFDFKLKTQATGAAIPDVDVALKSNGTTESINIESLDIATLGGNITGKANANWKSLANWQAELKLKDIQPGLQWEAAEGNISGELKTSGELTEQGGWMVNVPTLDIQGILRNNPLLLKGQLDADDKDADGEINLNTDGLRLSHAGNGLTIKGKVSKDLNLDVDIQAPQLANSVADLKGSIIGTVALRGKQTEPHLVTDINVSAINWNDEAKLERLTLKGNISPLPAPKGDLVIQAKNGSFGENKLTDLMVKFSGDETDHRLTLDAITNLISADLVLSGGLKQGKSLAWAGTLEEANISHEHLKLAIDHPVNISYDGATQRAKVQAHCWQDQTASICINKDVSAGESGEVDLQVNGFNLKRIQQFMPPDIAIEGDVGITAWAKWAKNKAPELKVNVGLPKGSVKQVAESPLVIGWDKVQLNAEMKNNKLALNWLLDFTKNGDIQGQLSIPDVQADDLKMTGQNKINKISLAALRPLVGKENKIRGRINSKLDFNGSMLHPEIKGNFIINRLMAEGVLFPVDLHRGNIKTQFDGYSATMKSKLVTKDGDLSMEGDANWADMENWVVNLHTLGETLNVESLPMVRLKVKPEITVSVTPTLATIVGTVDIPWGRIVVADLPASAVGVSSDEVILNHEMKEDIVDTGLPMELKTDITINIGSEKKAEEVRLAAYGLAANLVGQLKISQKNKAPFILGEIHLEEGTYKSFGQDLEIREGRIIMNGPADQPYLSIEAIRNPDSTEDNVTAGIRITGPASAPVAKVFSDPAMSTNSALSYLLRGRDIDATGGGSMATALIGLTLAQTGGAVGDIGNSVGIDDLQVGTAGSGDDSQVTVSGYIAPGLQIKYGVGIFDAVGEFTVRYELMQDLYIDAVTGLDSAVDVLYQFSFD